MCMCAQVCRSSRLNVVLCGDLWDSTPKLFPYTWPNPQQWQSDKTVQSKWIRKKPQGNENNAKQRRRESLSLLVKYNGKAEYLNACTNVYWVKWPMSWTSLRTSLFKLEKQSDQRECRSQVLAMKVILGGWLSKLLLNRTMKNGQSWCTMETYLKCIHKCQVTIDMEIFGVKISSWIPSTTKTKNQNIFHNKQLESWNWLLCKCTTAINWVIALTGNWLWHHLVQYVPFCIFKYCNNGKCCLLCHAVTFRHYCIVK